LERFRSFRYLSENDNLFWVLLSTKEGAANGGIKKRIEEQGGGKKRDQRLGNGNSVVLAALAVEYEKSLRWEGVR